MMGRGVSMMCVMIMRMRWPGFLTVIPIQFDLHIAHSPCTRPSPVAPKFPLKWKCGSAETHPHGVHTVTHTFHPLHCHSTSPPFFLLLLSSLRGSSTRRLLLFPPLPSSSLLTRPPAPPPLPPPAP
eukprot:1122352-Rhodomonas_salina.1